jgi:ATP-dependent Lon protease
MPATMASPGLPTAGQSILAPVLPLRDLCLFPEASLALVVTTPAVVKALEIARRTGRRILAVAQKESTVGVPSPRDLHQVGTLAELAEDVLVEGGAHRIELDGLQRARVDSVIGVDTFVGEAELLAEGDPGDEWGPAVEALARYLHAHADLRSFIDQQRRSKEPMAWVNLACQHLPIASATRQRLLESGASERCVKISRGLGALLRKEHAS